MSEWIKTIVGQEIDLAYGKSLPASVREVGPFEVFGSNGCVGHHKEPLIPGPGIVVGRKGSVGEVAYSSKDFWPIDTTYYVVNRTGNDWRFLFHLLSSLGLTELNSHSAVPGLNREDVYSIGVTLPPKPEQKQISAVLDALKHGQELELNAITQALDLKRSAMRLLFAHGLKGDAQRESELGLVPESWKVERLGANHSVVSGGTPSRSNAAYWTSGTIPWVKTTEVNYCTIMQTEELITHAGLAESAAKLLPAGTLLLAMYGQGVTRGRVAILGIEAACNQACAAMMPTSQIVDTKYLYHFLSNRYAEIRQLAHGGQQQNLNLDIVRDLPVAFPVNEDEQKEIVSTLDAIDRKADLHRHKRAVLDDLFKALLHKLIAGEIRVADLDLSALESPPAANLPT